MRNSQPAVALNGVTKRYGGVVAVDGVSLTVCQGESVALVGPSGAGKTTLLHMVAGMVRPDQGNVSVAGYDLAALRPGRELSALVGIVAQQFDLVPNLSALQNVLAGRLGAWGVWRSLISLVAPRERPMAIAALDRVGVRDRASVRAGRLSGGEQQRVAIARLLVQDPALVLADEPVASLDPARAADVLSLLTAIVRERDKTLVASMHAVDLARTHFDRLVGMRNGVVVFDQPAADVDEGQLEALYLLEGMRGE